ncbi:hypothetical protein MP228_012981 [Amoeboaphelidium protococcarum]|nr:hypothetical protein MP228_012981 [Amoeboaphelidium protococcarum]
MVRPPLQPPVLVKYNNFSVVYVAFCFLWIVPIWLGTTAVYRAQLPFDRLSKYDAWLKNQVFKYPLNVMLHIPQTESDRLSISAPDIQTAVEQLLQEHGSHSHSLNCVQWDLRVDQMVFDDIGSSVNVIPSAYNIQLVALDTSRIHILVEDQSRSLILQYPKGQDSGYIQHLISEVLATILIQESYQINDQCNSKQQSSNQVVQHSASYHFSFRLLNGDSDQQLYGWDSSLVHQKFMEQLLHQLQIISDVSVEYSMQDYADLAVQPSSCQSVDQQNSVKSLSRNLKDDVEDDDNDGESVKGQQKFCLSMEQQSHLINFGKWKLDSSSNASVHELNFITYIPSRQISPLYLQVDSRYGQGNESLPSLSSTNSILLPRWGGIHVISQITKYREDYDNDDNYSKQSSARDNIQKLSNDQLSIPFGVFISQIQTLFGVQPVWPSNDLSRHVENSYHLKVQEHQSKSGISVWQMDILIRKKIAQNIIDTFKSIQALQKMLEKLTNMAVSDSIRQELDQVFDHLDVAMRYVQKDQRFSTGVKDSVDTITPADRTSTIITLMDCYQSSKAALELAEKVFFDPTMMSLLYFPNEHLLAVYAPLLFPVFVPVFMSVRKMLST